MSITFIRNDQGGADDRGRARTAGERSCSYAERAGMICVYLLGLLLILLQLN